MNWQGVGEAVAAQASRAPRTPGDELAAYLNRSASSAVQSRFQEGVRAVQAADGTSAGATTSWTTPGFDAFRRPPREPA